MHERLRTNSHNRVSTKSFVFRNVNPASNETCFVGKSIVNRHGSTLLQKNYLPHFNQALNFWIRYCCTQACTHKPVTCKKLGKLAFPYLSFISFISFFLSLFSFLSSSFFSFVVSWLKLILFIVLCLSYTSSPPPLHLSPSAPISPHFFLIQIVLSYDLWLLSRTARLTVPVFVFSDCIILAPLFVQTKVSLPFGLWRLLAQKPLRLTCTIRYYTLNSTHSKIYDELLLPHCQNRTCK